MIEPTLCWHCIMTDALFYHQHKKVKASPIYEPYVSECLFERTLALSYRLCEVGWPVPFLTAFISPVFPPGPYSLLDGP